MVFVESKPIDSMVRSVENSFDLLMKPILFRPWPVWVIWACDVENLVLIFLLKWYSLPYISPDESPQMLSPYVRSIILFHLIFLAIYHACLRLGRGLLIHGLGDAGLWDIQLGLSALGFLGIRFLQIIILRIDVRYWFVISHVFNLRLSVIISTLLQINLGPLFDLGSQE